MNESIQEIIRKIKDIKIECPDCQDMYSDEQYTCAVCLCEGGQGYLVFNEWIKYVSKEDKHEELKRLQKEIDDCKEVIDVATQESWGVKPCSEEESEAIIDCYRTLESNQAKIKQIIEEL